MASYLDWYISASIDKDAVNKKFWEDPEFQKQVQNTKKASEVNPSDYDAILFVGGHGMNPFTYSEQW